MRGKAALFVERLPERGFRIDGKDRHVVVAPSGPGHVVRGVGDGDLLLVRRAGASGSEAVLSSWDGTREIGRTSRLPGLDEAGLSASILLDDGRLFRIVPRLSERGARIELRGWEDDGAYWTGRPARGRFLLEPTVAGRCLAAVDGLMILFAAEILEAFEE